MRYWGWLALILMLPGCPIFTGPSDDPLILEDMYAEADEENRVTVYASARCLSGVEGPGCSERGFPCVEVTWQDGATTVDKVSGCGDRALRADGDNKSFELRSHAVISQNIVASVKLTDERGSECDERWVQRDLSGKWTVSPSDKEQP